MEYFKITNIKIFNAAINLGTLFLIGLYSKETVVIYASTLAIITMSSSIWDAGAATLNSKIDLENNTAYRLAMGPTLSQGLKITAIAIALIYFFRQDGTGHQLMAAISVAAFMPTTYLLRWGIIKKRSGQVAESIIFSETVPSLLRFVLIPAFIHDPTSSFAIYYTIMSAHAVIINKSRKIKNLGLFSIGKTEINGINELSKLFFSIVTATKDQLLSLLSPFMTGSAGVAMVLQQRIVAVLQILLSGVHALLPLELRERNFRRIWGILFLGVLLWIVLIFSGNYLIKIISSGFPEQININFTPITWMVLWSPILFSLITTLMIADGRAKFSVLMELLQIIAFILVLRDI